MDATKICRGEITKRAILKFDKAFQTLELFRDWYDEAPDIKRKAQNKGSSID